LRRLEERFPEELVVVGVHSAKFPAEGETYNLRAAVMRHDIRHPVVNDRDFLLWRAYAARSWPTLVLIDPSGYIIGSHSGEFDAQELGDLLAQIVADQDAKGKLARTPLDLALEKYKQPSMLLSFPGKVLADPDGGRLFIADTEHHRVLAAGLADGKVRAVYGGGEPGFVDDRRGRARFRSPQGLALHRDGLYVADSENHAVRKIALDTGQVLTVAGTGDQASPWPEPGSARHAKLNSPWDVLIVGETLYVAMAGSHQIWTVDLHLGQLQLFAGDGRESLYDGPRLEARLAQPSGLATDGERLWFVDSETSSLRSVDLSDGSVKTWIGQGLFKFGDVNGDRSHALMQHPLGMACAGGLVYVADAYNNKVRVLDPATGELQGCSGSGEPGNEDGPAHQACFWEPGGLSAAGDYLYVADTNNHAIRHVDLRTGDVTTVELTE
jgi:sugar lactone lactonase YvrE